MRPDILNPLFRDVTSLAGVGPKVGEAIGRLLGTEEGAGLPRVVDLLFHLPTGIVDRRNQPGVARSPEGAIVTLELRIDRHVPPPSGNRKQPYRVFATDESGEIALVFFHAETTFLERMMPVGAIRYVSGRVEWFNGRPQMVHPDHVVDREAFEKLPMVEPVYPMTAGLARKTLARAVQGALEAVPVLGEWMDAPLLAQRRWPAFKAALEAAHAPSAETDLLPESPHLSRLAYDEILASQLALALTRANLRRASGLERRGDGRMRAAISAALPFSLTGSQQQAIAEIESDLAAPDRMLRLLQGDVGSGKTLVALMAAAIVVEAGSQAALMAPTELLARQHAKTLAPLAAAAGIRLSVLTGREKGRERQAILDALADGSLDLVVGTHAVFQAGVAFRDLGLAIVDEQHRFGVHQRLALAGKGSATDILVMTATPIPRTLVLAAFGDMDVSRLTEKPAGRRPIETRTIPLERLDEVVGRIGSAIAAGAKAYWVCPLVEESEEVDAAAAAARFAELRSALGPMVGLVHGRMKAAEKDAAMLAFQRGETRLLVATTVIEVGVDVPDATIMVIEHAERFGLAQLHQLRGRVGRGSGASTCLLLYRGPLGETAHDRLAIMRETEDGFRIAEEDLRLRGEGDLLGTKQSGVPGFRIASFEKHGALFEIARQDARMIVERDPGLESERGRALRLLLYLFGRDAAIRLLRAG
ncbi:ATP-dependent DNA helicase RecG [Kaistia geumhonensis]|uniref:ATP-dependent DNA helicase RecG n=1 Tax=Kaistia geumhonensis TaxID=410839 RepID=A0ABU0M1U7_9HYPH|nr:ATP-dependent DNA helicase RecG [Kaistia geumhonensis]MCX5479850.1 ATP-dependent DNA helicase RecG [Kaistia geumhonensis]MDQ0514924.1 ATP-dependent DNA helicase RecG [Kaistia geumhonensis]